MEAWREELYRNELYHAYTMYYSDELYHFGIPGMKWYIRRFQNPDGTLTELGRKHYGVGPPTGDDFEDYPVSKKYLRDRERYLRIVRSEAEREDKKREKAKKKQEEREEKKKKGKEEEEEEEKKKPDDKEESEDFDNDGLTQYTPPESKDAPKTKAERKAEEEKQRRQEEMDKNNDDADYYKTKKASANSELEYRKSKYDLENFEEDKRRQANETAMKSFKDVGEVFKSGGEYKHKTVENERAFVNEQTWTRKSKKELNRMSNEEFSDLINRMELERSYSRLTANDVVEGRHRTSQLLYDLGAITAVAAGITGTAAAIYSLKKKVSS